MSSTIFGYERDTHFMQQALLHAQRAAYEGEIPIGAVLVDREGTVVAGAHNNTEQRRSQQAHAEMLVMLAANTLFQDWRLSGCWLYTTLEPCLMCLGCMLASRLDGIVYGASSPLFGSILQLDKVAISSVYKMNMPIIIGGVCQDNAAKLLKQFFKEKRKSQSG